MDRLWRRGDGRFCFGSVSAQSHSTASAVGAEVDPAMFWAKLGNFASYFDRLLSLDTGARVWTDPAEWYWGLHRWLRLLGETLMIAYVGTLSGAALAFAACFGACRNLVPSALLRMTLRRVLELLRTVPDIVFAMIFVVAFGLGPLPGVLALTLHSAGTLGKLFTEVVESIDMDPVEDVDGHGRSWFARVRFGALPQVLLQLRQLHPVAAGNQCARRGRDRLCRRGRHRTGPADCDPQVLLRRCQCDAGTARALRHATRRRVGEAPAPVAGAGRRPVSGLRETWFANSSAPPAMRGRKGAAMFAAAVVITVYSVGLTLLDVTPGRLFAGVGRVVDIVALMLPPSPGSITHLWIYFGAFGQTLAIAFLGTGWHQCSPCRSSFVAARNIIANRVVHFLARRSLDAVRSVDTLIWAPIWINVVGLGPFAGALAIASTDVAALGKLMSEAIETVDRRPVEGTLAAGGGWLAVIRFGVLPQILPISRARRFIFSSSNTRSATIIGIVGAGGIGLYLSEMIRVLEWREVAFLILMVLVTVAIIDAISRRLRMAILHAG